ncbi:MAG TPA: hypothetical protein VMW17_11465 [Candidatus Binatia bacterium]|nr:hypothetical protein [Candidatus Binatia bacterium]
MASMDELRNQLVAIEADLHIRRCVVALNPRRLVHLFAVHGAHDGFQHVRDRPVPL